MANSKKFLFLLLTGVAVVGGCVFLLVSVPELRWRAEIVRMKATGSLPEMSWKELWLLKRRGDPLNLHGLLTIPSPYLVIVNPYGSKEGASAGEKIFQSNCTVCHGAGGVGGAAGPALKQRQMQRGSSDWALFKTITEGIPGTSMPPSSLQETDRWRLVAYVKSLAQSPPVQVDSGFKERLANLTPIRYEDILAGEQDSHRWLTYSGSYDAHRFSQNDQLTPTNVAGLRLEWMRQYTTSETLIETTPLIVDGFMFITVPPNRVEALDVKTGTLIWSFDHELPQRLSLCCGYVNRGLAVLGNTLFFGTLDAHLIALDAKTGKVLWDVQVADYRAGYSITSAPLALKNMVITGIAGGEFGIRGFVQARDAASGKEIWRFDTIPEPGQAGADTWEGDSWKTGGGPTWLTGTFDPESNLIYWPIGNPSPNFNGVPRKGDNLYTNSVVALDADDGSLRWHFQFTPHDMFDWDATEILVGFDKTVAGKHERYLAQANRNGFYYLLDGKSGQYLFSRPFTKQTWASEIDSHGRPVMNPGAIPTPKGALVYPGVGGASNWMSPSFSPKTGLMYVPVREWGGTYYSKDVQYRSGETFTGGYFQLITNPPPAAVVRALDPLTGEAKWEYRGSADCGGGVYTIGGVLSTKGNVVFGSAAHFLFALDALTGRELWRFDAGGPIMAAPITYSVGGKQFVTVAAGHDLLTFGL